MNQTVILCRLLGGFICLSLCLSVGAEPIKSPNSFRILKEAPQGFSMYGLQPGQSFSRIRKSLGADFKVVPSGSVSLKDRWREVTLQDKSGHRLMIKLVAHGSDEIVERVVAFPITQEFSVEADGRSLLGFNDTLADVEKKLGSKAVQNRIKVVRGRQALLIRFDGNESESAVLEKVTKKP